MCEDLIGKKVPDNAPQIHLTCCPSCGMLRMTTPDGRGALLCEGCAEEAQRKGAVVHSQKSEEKSLALYASAVLIALAVAWTVSQL